MTLLVMIIENDSLSLRGEISRWMIEPKAGVFVGDLSAIVRDLIWEKAIRSKKCGHVMQIWETNNEQGYSMRSVRNNKREPIDVDGITLIKYNKDISI